MGDGQGWEEIYAGVPTAPDTESAQKRHRTLREQPNMTAAEECELNMLFYRIYPQFHSHPRWQQWKWWARMWQRHLINAILKACGNF